MGRLFRKLLIQEVALAGNPVNGEKFILIKDGGLDMNDMIKLASLIVCKEDVPEVVKEEMKEFLPKEGETLTLGGKVKVDVKKDLDYEVRVEGISKEDLEKLAKFDEMKKELAELKKEDPETIMKDIPQAVRERLEKLEKDVEAYKEREKELKKESFLKDVEGKVGEAIAKDIEGIYEEGKETEIMAIVDRIAGMQKMVKDLGKSVGKKEEDDVDKLIEEGIAKIKKEKGIESDADAYVEFCKEHPDICGRKED